MAEKLNTGGVEAELAPDVSMVYDESRKDFCLASRYLNDNKKDRYIGLTMGELISAQGGERSRKNNWCFEKKMRHIIPYMYFIKQVGNIKIPL